MLVAESEDQTSRSVHIVVPRCDDLELIAAQDACTRVVRPCCNRTADQVALSALLSSAHQNIMGVHRNYDAQTYRHFVRGSDAANA